MPVAHEPLAVVLGKFIGIHAEQRCGLGLNRLRQRRSRAIAQYLGQRIGKSSWLGQLENVSPGHGVSLLRWRSGGVEHPHDTPPYLLTPSPSFAHSSRPLTWTVVSMLFTAAVLSTIPVSPQVTPQRGVELSVDQAQAQPTYGRYRR